MILLSRWGPVTQRHLAALQARAQQVAAELEGISRTYFVLFTGRSEADEADEAAANTRDVLLFTAEALMHD